MSWGSPGALGLPGVPPSCPRPGIFCKDAEQAEQCQGVGTTRSFPAKWADEFAEPPVLRVLRALLLSGPSRAEPAETPSNDGAVVAPVLPSSPSPLPHSPFWGHLQINPLHSRPCSVRDHCGPDAHAHRPAPTQGGHPQLPNSLKQVHPWPGH